MRNNKFYIVIIFLFYFLNSFAQSTDDLRNGSVSFISTQFVYVRFISTDGIQKGDTLFYLLNNKLEPGLIVKDLSSISCVCSTIKNTKFTVTEQIVAKIKSAQPDIELVAKKSKEAIEVKDVSIENTPKKLNNENKCAVDGRLSISSYSVISNDSNVSPYQKFRYNLSLNAVHLANTNLSLETYVSFTHKLGETQGVFDALKVYNLAVNYDVTKNAKITLGRKINPSMANIGAVDGLQFENTGKFFSYGALIGSRPDFYNYSFNPKLLEVGAYVSHRLNKLKGYMQTSVGIFNQTNNWVTDRRFAYIQHTNSLLRNLDFFGSAELDLYGKVNNKLTTKFDLTSTYLSLRYRPFKKLSISMIYDARKNVYYYETFKNYIDSILNKETRQGFRFQANYHPIGKLMVGCTAGYRFATTNTSASINGNTYLTYSQLPYIDASLTVNADYMNSQYIGGMIYGAALSRDFLDGKLFTELSYRFVDYNFTKTSSALIQNTGEISLGWRVNKKLLISADFEGTKDNYNNLESRLYINISQRF